MRIMRRDDTQAVADLRDGTADARLAALEQIYRCHGAAVLSFVSHCTGDALLAPQVVEEVFVRLWRQPRSFDPSTGSLRSHLVKDGYWRGEGLVCLDPGQSSERGPGRPMQTSAGPGVRAGDGIAPVSIDAPAGWQALSLDERVAVGFVQFGQMSTSEIAEFLGVDHATVHARLTGGLARLAEPDAGRVA